MAANMPARTKRNVKAAPAGGAAGPVSRGQSGPARQSDVDLLTAELSKLKAQSELVFSSQLPDEIIGVIDNVAEGQNRYGRPVIKFYVTLDDGRRTVISYPKTAWGLLAERLSGMGFQRLADVIGVQLKFKREIAGRLRFPRHFPTEVVKA